MTPPECLSISSGNTPVTRFLSAADPLHKTVSAFCSESIQLYRTFVRKLHGSVAGSGDYIHLLLSG